MRSKLSTALLLSALCALSAAAEDQDWASGLKRVFGEVRKEAKNKADRQDKTWRSAAVAPWPSQVVVSDPWTDETRQRMYNWEGPPSWYNKAAGAFLWESPLPVAPTLGPLTDPFPDQKARQIAQACRQSFPEPWDRIGCVSRAMSDFYRGYKFTGVRSFCRSYAEAFQKSFQQLSLDHTWVTKAGGSGRSFTKEGHVVNAITVTSAEGVVYAYVIDSGWFPGVLFPLNEAAVAFHSRRSPGHTDFPALPAISEHPFTGYRAAP